MLAASGDYAFAAAPRVVSGAAKYRQQENQRPANIMFDKRVVRGNTFSNSAFGGVGGVGDPIEAQKEAEAFRRQQARARQAAAYTAPRTPPAVQGRTHIDVQTDPYLEEIVDKVIEVEAETQTDAFLDRPATPLYIPKKTGIDVETQIEEGDLFNFDLEVEPLLEILVGRTLEQSLMEVHEEEELAALRCHQAEYEQIRNSELAEFQRMEEEEKRREEEKERRVQQETERLEAERIAAEKISSRGFAEKYLSGLMDSVFEELSETGHFYDPVEKEVNDQFLPWLMSSVNGQLQEINASRLLVDELLQSALGLINMKEPEQEQLPAADLTVNIQPKAEPEAEPEAEAEEEPKEEEPKEEDGEAEVEEEPKEEEPKEEDAEPEAEPETEVEAEVVEGEPEVEPEAEPEAEPETEVVEGEPEVEPETAPAEGEEE